MAIKKNKITSYGNMVYIAKKIKENGEYDTGNYIYALDNAEYWNIVMPVMLSNEKYAYVNVNTLPSDVLKLPSYEVDIND